MVLRDVVILHWLSPTGQCYTWLWGTLNSHPAVCFLCLVCLCCSWIVPRCPDHTAKLCATQNILKTWSLGRGEQGPAHGSAGTCLWWLLLCSQVEHPSTHSPSLRSHNPQIRSVQIIPLYWSHPWNSQLRKNPPLSPQPHGNSFIRDHYKATEIFSSSNIFPIMLLWEVP